MAAYVISELEIRDAQLIESYRTLAARSIEHMAGDIWRAAERRNSPTSTVIMTSC
jgi:uncharacterized protein (DUF1330 family)